MLRSLKSLTLISVMFTALCLTGCASLSSAWDSTTSTIGDFFKSDKPAADKAAAEKPAADKPAADKK
jgi:hypothetical protein